MDNLPRNFKGIWIPKEIWLHHELSFFEKCLWAEIHSLDDEIKGCTASNEYLWKVFGVHEKTLQRGLAKLKSLKFIRVESFDGRIRSLRASIKDIFVTSDPTPQEKGETIKDKFDTPGVDNLYPPNSPTPIDKEKKEEKKECPVPKFSVSSDALELAQDLWNRVLKIHPKAKEPKMGSWAKEMDKLMKIDSRSKEELSRLIKYVFEVDHFWVKVIQSPEGLRRNFDKIWVKMSEIDTEGLRIEKNREIAQKIKKVLSQSNEDKLLTIYKNSVVNENGGDSISMSLNSAQFEEVLVNWFQLRVSDGV